MANCLGGKEHTDKSTSEISRTV